MAAWHCFCTAVLLFFFAGVSLGVDDMSTALDITPHTYLPGVTTNVLMSCRPPVDADVSRVLTFQLYMHALGGEPLVSFVTTDPVPLVERLGAILNAKANGSFDVNNPHSAVLRVELPNPPTTAEGVYSCHVETLDSRGLLNSYTAQASLVSMAKNQSVPEFYHALLQGLRADLDTLTTDLNTVQSLQAAVAINDSQVETKLSAITTGETQINRSISDVQDGLRTVDKRVTNIQSSLMRLRDNTPAAPVNFYAYVSGNYITPSINANIVFNGIQHQTDDASYSASNGVFTTPLNGTYFFRTGITGNDASYSASILVNDQPVASLVGNDDYDIRQASACLVIQLTEGHEVRVVKKKGSRIYGYNPNSASSLLSYFMGMLLW